MAWGGSRLVSAIRKNHPGAKLQLNPLTSLEHFEPVQWPNPEISVV